MNRWLSGIGLLCLCPGSVLAEQLELPVQLEQALLQQLVNQQVFTDAEQRARVWDDGRQCNYLELYDPELTLDADGVRSRSQATARVGTTIGQRCLSVLHWQGVVEVLQQPQLGPEPGMVQFKVVDSQVYAADGQSRGLAGTVWNWVKQHAQPRFERLRVDLNPMLNELRVLLPLAFPAQPAPIQRILEGVTLSDASVLPERLQLTLSIDLPPQWPAAPSRIPATPLSEAELESWTRAWQQWDAFLTLLIKQAGDEAGTTALRTELLAVLLDARQDILAVLVPPDDVSAAADPVADLFVKTWQRLQPVLKELSATLPAPTALHYLGFISAADALLALEALGEHTGFALTADSLRQLARLANPNLTADPLLYDDQIDPELRRIFGFGDPLQPPPPEPLINYQPRQSRGLLAVGMFLPVAVLQDPHYTILQQRLNGWVPTIAVLDEYLPLMQQLLDRIVGLTLHSKPLDKEYREMFRPLMLATAWQESCWRQYIRQGGEIQTIRSSAGAIGIMQINQYVWRGFYDVEQLHDDVGYNALAGAEILHHYLMDYAVARGEHKLEGGLDNLVRATYAIYNGGPRHLSRYRREQASASLRKIDNAFWNKYEQVRAGETLAVAQCYVG